MADSLPHVCFFVKNHVSNYEDIVYYDNFPVLEQVNLMVLLIVRI